MVHFIIPREFEGRLEDLQRSRLEVDYPYWLGGRFNWPAQTWLVLREYREGLSIGTEPVVGVINVAHVQTWRALGRRRGEFRVSIRADYSQLFDADFEIVQNPAVRTNRSRLYLPYWPVPGVIPRRETRQGVRNVAYAGRLGPRNLVSELRDAKMLADAEVAFHVIPPNRWHDMSEVDVLVAVRSFDRKPHHSKPPSKLFHAWRAGVPLIAGWDSAYSAIGRPGKDYLRVESSEELGAALERLAEDPAVYDAIVAEGRRRALEVGHKPLARVWLEALEGQVEEAFRRWGEVARNPLKCGVARAGDQLREAASGAKRRLHKRFAPSSKQTGP